VPATPRKAIPTPDSQCGTMQTAMFQGRTFAVVHATKRAFSACSRSARRYEEVLATISVLLCGTSVCQVTTHSVSPCVALASRAARVNSIIVFLTKTSTKRRGCHTCGPSRLSRSCLEELGAVRTRTRATVVPWSATFVPLSEWRASSSSGDLIGVESDKAPPLHIRYALLAMSLRMCRRSRRGDRRAPRWLGGGVGVSSLSWCSFW